MSRGHSKFGGFSGGVCGVGNCAVELVSSPVFCGVAIFVQAVTIAFIVACRRRLGMYHPRGRVF